MLTALHAAGERVRLLGGHSGESEFIKRLLCARLGLPHCLPIDSGDESEILGDAQIRCHGRFLGREIDLRLDALRIGQYRFSQQVCIAACRFGQSAQHRDRRRLACAVHAEQCEDLALRHGDVEFVDRGEAAEGLGQVDGSYGVHFTPPVSFPCTRSAHGTCRKGNVP